MLFAKGSKGAQANANAQEPLYALDIGTSKIRLIEGNVLSTGEIEISYYSEIPSAGMVNGCVSDLNKLSEQISTLIQRYKQETENSFSKCFIGIAGRHIQSQNEKGIATVPSHKVTEIDRENALEHARSAKFSGYNHLLHVIPQAYETEDNTDITDPVGLSALRLGVGVHLIACNEDQENNLRAAFEKLDNKIQIEHVIYNGIAAADAVLSQEEKEIGVCVIDFGGGTIDVSVYDRSKLVLTFGLDKGGSVVTRNIATNFGITLRSAEVIKLGYGVAHPYLLSDKEAHAKLAVNEAEDKIYIERSKLSTSVAISLSDFFSMINDRLERYRQSSGLDMSIGAGFVLTGGVASTSGITTLAANKINNPDGTRAKVRVGLPRNVSGNYEGLKSPELATAIGLLRFGHAIRRDKLNKNLVIKEIKKNNGMFSRMVTWTKDWLSKEF